MTMYKVDRWSKERITAVEVNRATDKSVWFNRTDYRGRVKEQLERRMPGTWFESWQEAKDWIVRQAEANHENAKRHLDSARNELEVAKALRMVTPC